MITKLAKFLPTEEGVTVSLKFPKTAMPEIMKMYDQDVTIVPAQEVLPEAPPTIETMGSIVDQIMPLFERLKEQYIKINGLLPVEKEEE